MKGPTFASVRRKTTPDKSTLSRRRESIREYVLRRLGRQDELEKFIAGVYSRLCMSAPSDAEVSDPIATLLHVIRNEMLDRDTPSTAERKAALNDKTDVERALVRALRNLTRKQAFILILIDGCKLRQKDVARKLEISTHTVKKYLTMARAKLRESLENSGDSNERQS